MSKCIRCGKKNELVTTGISICEPCKEKFNEAIAMLNKVGVTAAEAGRRFAVAARNAGSTIDDIIKDMKKANARIRFRK